MQYCKDSKRCGKLVIDWNIDIDIDSHIDL